MSQEIIRIDLGSVNCYLAKTENGFILFDTGGHIVLDKLFTNRLELLEAELDKAGCNPGNLSLVILTHGHNDHACNAFYIREKYNTKIAMHPNDCVWVESPDINKLMSSYQYQSLTYKIIFKILRKTIYEAMLKTLTDFEKFTPDILIDEQFNLSDYGFDGEVLHIPGHTSGSIGILTGDKQFIAGDVFANTKKPAVAINALDFNQLAQSIKKLKTYQIETVYPGHGEPFLYKTLPK